MVGVDLNLNNYVKKTPNPIKASNLLREINILPISNIWRKNLKKYFMQRNIIEISILMKKQFYPISK